MVGGKQRIPDMARARPAFFGFLFMIALAGSFSCRADRQSATPSNADDQHLLEIGRDGSLSLDGKKTNSQDSAREFARLADKVHSKARTAGKPLEPEPNSARRHRHLGRRSDPVLQLAFPLMRQIHDSGFSRYRLAPKSVYPHPAALQGNPGDVMPPLEAENDLPDAIRTLPIDLHADERGEIAGVELGEHLLPDLRALRGEVRAIQNDLDTPFDKARLVVDSRLAFSELVRVVELLAASKVKAIDIGLMETAERAFDPASPIRRRAAVAQVRPARCSDHRPDHPRWA